MNYLKVLILIFALLHSCISYKILVMLPMPMHSHYILSSKLVKELANKNHEVTFFTPFPGKNLAKNLKEVPVETLAPKLHDIKSKLYGLGEKSVFGSTRFLTNMGLQLTETILENENVQKLLHSKEEYDLVIIPQFLNEALIGIAHHFKAPFVLVSPMPLFSWGSFLLSHPSPSSYVPNLLSPFTGHMNFWERLSNSIYDVISILYHQLIILPKHRELVRKYLPGKPDLYDFLNNASIVLINSHVSIYDSVPQVPNVIEIGGMHLQEPKKLPEDLQKFLDESTNGVVLFSMGSNLNSSSLGQFKRDALLKAFSQLKQNVLWKWETDELPGQPKNVKLMKWLPQSDILAHPNVKAFITHGGLFSTIESIYHGVPVIGIPVFSDQKMNIASAASYGYATAVSILELTEEKLSKALQEVLYNPRYKENAMKRSKIMRDRPIKPMDQIIFWIEYVIRHQGAPHLKYPGMDLYWYQRNLLDVFVFVVLTGFLILWTFFTLLKFTRNKLFRVDDKEKKNK